MSKKVIYALLLIGLSVIIMILNRSSISINVFGMVIRTIQSFAILGFIAVGVVIGLLLK